MLYTLHKSIGSSSAIEQALEDLRMIIDYRMQTHFENQQVNFKSWLSNQFNGTLLNRSFMSMYLKLQMQMNG